MYVHVCVCVRAAYRCKSAINRKFKFSQNRQWQTLAGEQCGNPLSKQKAWVPDDFVCVSHYQSAVAFVYVCVSLSAHPFVRLAVAYLFCCCCYIFFYCFLLLCALCWGWLLLFSLFIYMLFACLLCCFCCCCIIIFQLLGWRSTFANSEHMESTIKYWTFQRPTLHASRRTHTHCHTHTYK